MGLQKIITQETKQQNNYLESESVLDYDFSIAQPELAAVKIYEVRKSSLLLAHSCAIFLFYLVGEI